MLNSLQERKSGISRLEEAKELNRKLKEIDIDAEIKTSISPRRRHNSSLTSGVVTSRISTERKMEPDINDGTIIDIGTTPSTSVQATDRNNFKSPIKEDYLDKT